MSNHPLACCFQEVSLTWKRMLHAVPYVSLNVVISGAYNSARSVLVGVTGIFVTSMTLSTLSMTS